jgi:hypothetical protein
MELRGALSYSRSYPLLQISVLCRSRLAWKDPLMGDETYWRKSLRYVVLNLLRASRRMMLRAALCVMLKLRIVESKCVSAGPRALRFDDARSGSVHSSDRHHAAGFRRGRLRPASRHE